MSLNEKLVEEAAKAAQDSSPFVNWDAVGHREQGQMRDKMRAAIAHYLTHRSLPDRMGEAAEVLGEVNDRHRYGTVMAYGPGDLRQLADRWEVEDAALADQDALVEEMASRLYHGLTGAAWIDAGPVDRYREVARDLAEHFSVKPREVAW